VIETFHILAQICELEAAEIEEADPANVTRLRAMFQRGRDPHPLVAGAASEIEALARRKDDVEHLRDLAGRLRLHIEELQRTGVEKVPTKDQLFRASLPPEGQAAFDKWKLTAKDGEAFCWDPEMNKRAAEIRALHQDEHADRLASLPQIRQDLGDCHRCGLCQTRQSIVFGEGPESAQVAFVGEAPGADEDRSGLPFQGQAGALLDKMLLAMQKEARGQGFVPRDSRLPIIPNTGAINNCARDWHGCSKTEAEALAECQMCQGQCPDRSFMFARHSVRILNTVMCRPPLNRKPDPEEVAQCMPFLERQLMALPNLKVIVTLGATPATALLPKFKRLSDIRGRWQEWRGVPLMPTWHPAYLLRDPSHKGETWEDLKLVIERMK